MSRFLAQETPYFCGPASLQIVQTELGWRDPHSQKTWANIIGTTSTGTSPAGVKRGLRYLGKEFRIIRQLWGKWGDPKAWQAIHTPQMAIVYDHSRDHWLVAKVAANRDLVSIVEPLQVYLLDPEGPQITVVGWDEFHFRFFRTKKHGYGLFFDPSLQEQDQAEMLRRAG